MVVLTMLRLNSAFEVNQFVASDCFVLLTKINILRPLFTRKFQLWVLNLDTVENINTYLTWVAS